MLTSFPKQFSVTKLFPKGSLVAAKQKIKDGIALLEKNCCPRIQETGVSNLYIVKMYQPSQIYWLVWIHITRY
jgi:hypothetical protein